LDIRTDERLAHAPDFGDVMRVRAAPETTASGHAGREGDVMGASLRVAMLRERGEQVVGVPKTDEPVVALVLEGESAAVWFAAHLLEHVRTKEFELRIAGRTVTRRSDGTWDPAPPESLVVPLRPRRFAWLRRLWGRGPR
jgi:hypothetical protein